MQKGRQFKRRLFWTYSSVIFILLLILFGAAFFIIHDESVSREINTQQEFIIKTQQQVDASLQNMDRIANGLLYNKTFMRIMRDGLNETTFTKDNNEVVDIMVSLDAPQFQTHRIIAFAPDSPDMYFSFAKTGDDHIRVMSAIKSYELYGRLELSNGDKLILPPRADPFDSQGSPVYSVARTVTDGMNVYGIVEVQNPYAQLESLCGIDASLGGIAVLSPGGGIIYPMPETGGDGLPSGLYQNISSRGNGPGSFQAEGFQVSYAVSDYSGWTTVMYSPLSYFNPDPLLIGVFLLGLALALALALSLVRILTGRMAAPLMELNRRIHDVSYENLAMDMPRCNIVEIDDINASFQAMLNQLKVEIARNTEARANAERANYIALQAQMNPHTIYNTISMIESVCYINGDHEAARLCIAFSKMLRYISDNTKSDYTLEDELRHLENYGELMRKRYENQLQLEISFDPSLLSKTVPKFSLQPLVENSIKHGMSRDSQPFIIKAAAEKTAEGWSVTVSDNGKGFSEEKLNGVYRQFAAGDESLLDHRSEILHTRIDNMALNNIYIRWRILMGAKFRMSIKNQKPNGCAVELAVRDNLSAEVI